MDFAVPADHRVEIKDKGKINKWQDLARELKEIGALRTIPKGSVKELAGGIGNKKTRGDHPD